MNKYRNNKKNQIILATYASILRKRSNTNSQRKLSKQNIAEINNNTSISQKLLTNTQNKSDHNKRRSAASATSNTDEEVTQNPIEKLEEEIVRLKERSCFFKETSRNTTTTCYTSKEANFTSFTIRTVTTKDNPGQ